MPLNPNPNPGMPQVPIGAHRIWRAQIALKRATKAANIPVAASPAGILRALMLSGLAASALRTFQVVVGDVETDMDDLIDTIQQWLKAQGDIGFSRQIRPPERGPKELAIPIPLKPLKKGQRVDTIEDADLPEPEPDRRKRDRDRPDQPSESYWTWLERRFGNPPKYQNLNRSMLRHGISSF